MRRHVLDRPTAVSNEMLRRVIAIRRAALPRAASVMLQRRRRQLSDARRTVQFLRIARGSMV
ncbi:hypothetical protein [Yoonia sp.]|uniref:hypothetical protein n=1 Tax=Yoonia sp. TaxID=2212373 RepID=UPI0025DE48BB|nr:hypothetical protein [Yoonia sp.]